MLDSACFVNAFFALETFTCRSCAILRAAAIGRDGAYLTERISKWL